MTTVVICVLLVIIAVITWRRVGVTAHSLEGYWGTTRGDMYGIHPTGWRSFQIKGGGGGTGAVTWLGRVTARLDGASAYNGSVTYGKRSIHWDNHREEWHRQGI